MAVARPPEDPIFWQTLLAAETSASRARAVLDRLGQFSGDPVSFLHSTPLLTDVERHRMRAADTKALRRAMDQGVRILLEQDFPPRVGHLDNMPPALFVWGDAAAIHGPCVAIVGTRAASTYGKLAAAKFAEALARAGVTVVSGGALGIDAAAHEAALSAGGKTVAVLATGVEGVFPSKHAGLFERIRSQGCLVSQYSVGSRAPGHKFLARNDLIAALSDAVLVVEAPLGSGSLRTAHSAAEFGRPVFVVPSNIDNIKFHGSHALIRDGAVLVDHPSQVFELLALELIEAEPASRDLSEVQESIIRHLGVDPIAPEKLVQLTGMDPAELLSELTMMEIEGLVVRDGASFAKPI